MRKNVEEIKEQLIPVFEKYRDRIVFAYLFGSTARSDLYPSGDVDIAVSVQGADANESFDLKLSLHADFCRALKRRNVDVVILNRTKNIMLLDQIVREGIVLFDTDEDARQDFEVDVLHRAMDFKEHRLSVMGM